MADRIAVVVRLDTAVDGGEGRTQEHIFSAVDSVGVSDGCLVLHCGPCSELFPMAHVVWWTERPQTREEAQSLPGWEAFYAPPLVAGPNHSPAFQAGPV